MEERIVKYKLGLLSKEEELIFISDTDRDQKLQMELTSFEQTDKVLRRSSLFTPDAFFITRLQKRLLEELVLPEYAILNNGYVIKAIVLLFILISALIMVFDFPKSSITSNGIIDVKTINLLAYVSLAIYSLLTMDYFISKLFKIK